MINLTQSQFNLFKANCHFTSLQDIKSVLKCLRIDGLAIPKLNSKKDVIMDYWQQLTMATINFAANNTPKIKLFASQLTNVGIMSKQALLLKLN